MTKTSQIKKITEGFIGQKCVQAARTYGTMFILDFGKEYSPKPPSKFSTFDWSLLVENSRYIIFQNDKELAHQNTDEKILQSILDNFVDLKILELKINEKDNHASFVFEKGYEIHIDPFTRSEAWNLRDPKGYFLGIGPDNYWEYN